MLPRHIGEREVNTALQMLSWDELSGEVEETDRQGER
jgi:hypothetical protein